MKTRQSLSIVLVAQQVLTNDAFMTNKPQRHLDLSAQNSRTALFQMQNGKDNHRARVEKNLEEMMGRDWRIFRARLVAQEAVEEREMEQVQQTRKNTEVTDTKQAKQEKFGNLFAAIFNSKDDSDDRIFDGNGVGGATTESIVPADCEDPFVSKDELPVLLQPKVHVDKHRWAHALPHIEPGCVLIANEKLGGVFHQTVVLIIEHNDVTGSTGIVINRPMSESLNGIAAKTQSNLDLSLKLAFNSAPVTYGGPVMAEEYSILHGYGEVEGATKIAPGIFVGGSEELMKEVRKNHMNPDQALFVKGHAAWVPGQLTREVSKGVWYPASVSNDFILRYAGAPTDDRDNKGDLWADILTCMGDHYKTIANLHSSKGDKRILP